MVPLFNWSHPPDTAIALLLKKPETFIQHKLAALIFILTQQSIAKAWCTLIVHLHEAKTRMLTFMINAKLFVLLNDKM